MIKKLIVSLMILTFTLPASAGIVTGGAKAVVATDGFVGNNDAANDTSSSGTTNDCYFQEFTATTSGAINYIHFEANGTLVDGAPPNTELGIYDSSKNLIESTGQVTITDSSQNDYALQSEVNITSGTTYYLALGTAGDSYWTLAGKSGGDLLEDSGGYSSGLPDPIVQDQIVDSNFTHRIWCDNSAT